MSEPRWVERDVATGKIVGHFACAQPGYAEECLPGDHPDLVAWREEREIMYLADLERQPAVLIAVLTARVDALEERIKKLEG